MQLVNFSPGFSEVQSAREAGFDPRIMVIWQGSLGRSFNYGGKNIAQQFDDTANKCLWMQLHLHCHQNLAFEAVSQAFCPHNLRLFAARTVLQCASYPGDDGHITRRLSTCCCSSCARSIAELHWIATVY